VSAGPDPLVTRSIVDSGGVRFSRVMTLRDFRRVMRRGSWIALSGAFIGVVVGWLTAPGATSTVTFEATNTLFLVRPVKNSEENIRLSGVVATLGAVPDRVSLRMGIDRESVRSMVSAVTVGPGVLSVTGHSLDRNQAQDLANVTAEELVVELGGANSPLQILEPAVAKPAKGDFQGPTSRPSRALALGGFGLLLGVAGAFGLDRFDTRIRSKNDAEKALAAPVLREMPSLRPSEYGHLLTEGSSTFIEACRGLRTSVEHWATGADGTRPRQILIVTSPAGGGGTTTTVAHLAAALGEVGRRVVAISGDLRNPRLHRYFDHPRDPGLTDVLRGAPDVRRLTDLNLVTAVPGVRLISSGPPVPNPSTLLDQIGNHLEDVRHLADFVLIDAPPLLVTNDAADLARHADGVLLVLRAGRTPARAATRSVELLERLDIPIIGAVLVGSHNSAVRSS
jgi:capsular exopolysaccharide synthesis family protein